tara:strand:- start:712 stop:870 length:159 start_codon:yes stop_codon:yes gene_type:complete
MNRQQRRRAKSKKRGSTQKNHPVAINKLQAESFENALVKTIKTKLKKENKNG